MALNFNLNTTSTSYQSSDKWRRTRGDNGENVAGTITIADFSAHVNESGFIPSGVAVSYDETDGVYKPLVIATGEDTQTPLDGFISDQTGVDTNDGATTSGVSVSIRETIVPRYLPVEAHRVIDSAFPTTGDFVFIKE